MNQSLPGSDPAGKPKEPPLLEQVRAVIRFKHYSIRTEQSYLDWIKRFILFHGKQHPRTLGAPEVRAFLTHLAVEGKVAASTQNQAQSALLFLYRQVLRLDLPFLHDVERAKRPRKLPVVLTRLEATSMLDALTNPTFSLMGWLLYGSGLRLMECVRLRVKDVDFAYRQLTVRDGKGQKDRVTLLPERIHASLRLHLAKVKALHDEDLAQGGGSVYLPFALERKYPNAPRAWEWQYVFPAAKLSVDPRSGGQAPPPRGGEKPAKRRQGGGTKRRDHQARKLSQPASLLRHAPAGERLRHPHDPGTARPPGRGNDHDLHPCAQPARVIGQKPGRRGRQTVPITKLPVSPPLDEPARCNPPRSHADPLDELVVC